MQELSWKMIFSAALQRHNTENSKQIFPEKELRSHTPNFYIHVSLSDLYIPVCLFCHRKICGLILGIYKYLTDTLMWNLGLRPRNSISGKYINWIFVAVCDFSNDCRLFQSGV